MTRLNRLTREQALLTYCRQCDARPGSPCVYIDHLLSKPELIGTPTERPHNTRFVHPHRRLQLWLRDNATIFWENP